MVAWGRVETAEKVLADLRADERVTFAFPVYGHSSPTVGDTQLIVALKDGVAISQLSNFLAEVGVSPGGRAGPEPPNGPNYYFAYLSNPKSQDPFVISRKLTSDSRVIWVEPNFRSEGSLCPRIWDYLRNIDSGPCY